MTTSIMVNNFMTEVHQTIAASPFSKNQIESKINDLFNEFCRKAEKFSNKESLISEATIYKSEILNDLDQILPFFQSQSLPPGTQKV